MAHFVDTPRTDAVDRTRFTIPDLSELPSFQAPAGKDDLMKAVRNQGNRQHVFATPSARAPLASRHRQMPNKNEFTPLLKSATKNRMMLGREEKENGVMATPAALKPGFQLSSPNVPEASSIDNSSMISDRTPVADVNSSSFENSTPMALPKGQLDNGNVLTLREQEAKLEKIDKENFGLKLKIHFLEENLKKTGTEWSQQAVRENTELKVSQLTMERELKKYRKQLVQAEHDLQSYKQQLQDYAENLRRKHADEATKDELERLQTLVDERDDQLAQMQLRLESAENTMQSMGEQEKLRENIEELEAELQGKDRELEERDDEIESLKEKLRDAENNAEAVDESERQLQEKADRIDELEAELQQVTRQKEEELDALQEEHDSANREHEVEIEDLRAQLENAQKDKRDQLREFEAQLIAYNREKTAEVEDLQRKLAAAEKDKADEVESLELRIKLAESKGDNQSQLAQQAAEDARNQVKQVTAEKDAELEDLRAQLQSMHGIQDELETCQKQIQDYAADTEKRHASDRLREDVLTKLRDTASEKDREIRQLKSTVAEQGSPRKEVSRLRESLNERERNIVALQKTVDAQATSLEDLRRTRTELAAREQALKAASDDLNKAHATVTDRDRQLEAQRKSLEALIADRDDQIETLRKTLDDRVSELEVLRQANEEPGTQLEGMQSIIRHRDNDLDELRDTVDELETRLESLQITADERLRAIEELQQQLAETKQNLEDEIQVLEATLDEAESGRDQMQSKMKILESQLEDTRDLQTKLSPMGKDLRAAQREQARLEKEIDSLQRDREIADHEREDLQNTIEQLRKDLKTAQGLPKLTPSRDRQTESLRKQLDDLHLQLTQKQERHTRDINELQSLLRKSTLDLETASLRLNDAEEQLRLRTREIAELQSDSTRQLHSQAQEGREENGRLRSDIMALEKKHVAELRGLAKQITYLRSRCERERSFREGLGFQKEWFLMNVEMYAECNKADLRLLEDMGITPSRSIREQRPTLRTVGQMVVFMIRARRLAGQWSEKRKVQEQLATKLEGMRGAKKTQQQRTGAAVVSAVRKGLPLGIR